MRSDRPWTRAAAPVRHRTGPGERRPLLVGSESARAALLAGAYFGCGVLWIFFSDRELAEWISSPDLLTRAQTLKGLLFIFVTATLLFYLARTALVHRNALLSRGLLTEQKLRDAEVMRRSIIDAELECVKIVSPQGTIVEMNPAGLAMIDADFLEQVAGRAITDFVAPEFRTQFVRLHERVMEGQGGTLQFESVGLKGSRRFLETHAVPMRDVQGRVTGLLGVTRDITASRVAAERLLASEKLYRELFESNPNIMCVFDADTLHFLEVNSAMCAHYGYSRDEFLSMTIKDIRPADEVPALLENLRQAGSGLDVPRLSRHRKKGGEIMEAEVRSHTINFAGRNARLALIHDVTRQRRAEERLRLDAAAFASTSDGVMIADLDERIISVNRAFMETTGYAEAELLGQSPRILQSGRHSRDFYRGMWFALSRGGSWRGEIWNRRKSGETFPVWLNISTVHDARGDPTHYVAIYTDISKLKESEEKLKYLAHYDPLTDLPNRLLMQSRLDHAIAQAQRHNHHVSILFIDLDDFKQVNDSLGHVVGDELLMQVARRLRARLRNEDTLARLGGDEFVVLLEKLERADGAATVARAMLSETAVPFQLRGGRELYVRGSIGISVFPGDGATASELLRAADTAMYQAKAAGGDRFLFFTSAMGAEVLAGMELETALRRALEHKEMTLYFQPRVDLRDGRLQGAEALLRWFRNGTDAVPPGSFIPVAERSGLIVPIGNWVIDAACRQYRFWVEQGLPPVQIGINVSARQFRDAGLARNIADSLHKYDMPAAMLVLELTESMLMERTDEAVEVLQELNRIGVQISLDDFGTGFSSLSYLTRFPIDTIKIDRSFVASAETDGSAQTIINLVIRLAHGLGLKVIAEGVETEGQCAYLRRQGCDEMQGYFYSRPLPPEKFAELLLSGKPLGTP